ncbi:MAG: thiamine-monophosphate kinase [Candidatus Lokiarchaeota archaeon]|nr:thiamine-monophosphate kinase [Candidatus Lokiarchaeota archaeon]
MKQNENVSFYGELGLIELIDKVIYTKTGKRLRRDDSFFFKYEYQEERKCLVLNSDMFNATTDAPKQMNFYQMGVKSVHMNISDLVVKGVKPEGIIVSLGLPNDLLVLNFKRLIEGIVDYSNKWNLNYLGGDLNASEEVIINPTVFGFKNPTDIIYRKGIKPGDIIAVNNKFGLTGVGFDILLCKDMNVKDSSKYSGAINSVLEPNDLGKEAYILADNNLATASIDSSDGLSKTLKDLLLSNPNLGFEIDFDDNLIHKTAIEYSNEFSLSLEKLIFEAGEEFIHLFAIDPTDFDRAQKLVKSKGGRLFKIGKAISDKKIYFIKNGKRFELKNQGYEHFK